MQCRGLHLSHMASADADWLLESRSSRREDGNGSRRATKGERLLHARYKARGTCFLPWAPSKLSTSLQAAEYTAAVAQAIAEDNARAAPVLVSGATGWNFAAINGFFAPTLEKGLDGRVVYSKCGDASVCIEHCVGMWTIKSTQDKLKSDCSEATVEGGCSIEACASRTWSLGNANGSRTVQSLKIETGPEVERQVSSRHALLTSFSPTALSRPFDAWCAHCRCRPLSIPLPWLRP
jgi:hypothetical protein